MKIDNVEVYDFDQSIVASGLPMKAEYDGELFSVSNMFSGISGTVDMDRAVILADNPSNSGHCNFLKGIIVSFNVSGTIKWWEQFQRYHFATIISSQSTMHRITKMDFDKCLSPFVLEDTKRNCENLVKMYNAKKIDFNTMIDNIPLGLVLTARVQTNYLQLRTIYSQRRNHKYHEWKPFCDWIETLPSADELICVKLT